MTKVSITDMLRITLIVMLNFYILFLHKSLGYYIMGLLQSRRGVLLAIVASPVYFNLNVGISFFSGII